MNTRPIAPARMSGQRAVKRLLEEMAREFGKGEASDAARGCVDAARDFIAALHGPEKAKEIVVAIGCDA